MPYRVLIDGGKEAGPGWSGSWSRSAAPPIVVSFGAGLDSTALLIGMAQQGIRPAAIVFAAVGDFRDLPEGCSMDDLLTIGKQSGDEHSYTYEHIVRFDEWLALNTDWECGITVITYVHKTGRYAGLYGKCMANGTLPSISYGGHSCSLTQKGEIIDRWVRESFTDAWQVERYIGYDAGCKDKRRSKRTFKTTKDPRWVWKSPLQDWGWTREDCEDVCRKALGYVAEKSSCYFCAAKSLDEIIALGRDEPRLAYRCVQIEEAAQRTLREPERGLSGPPRVGRKRKDGSWVSKPRPGRWTDIWRNEGLLDRINTAGRRVGVSAET